MSIQPKTFKNPIEILARLPKDECSYTLGFLDTENQNRLMRAANRSLYKKASTLRMEQIFHKSLFELKTIAARKTFKNRYPNLQTIVEKILLSGNEITKNDPSGYVFAINKQLRHLYNPVVQTAARCRAIPSYEKEDEILYPISISLKDGGNFDEAIEIAKTISRGTYNQSLALLWICRDLVKIKDFDRAIQVANAILDFDRAIQVANTILDVDYQTIALQEISLALAKEGNLTRAVALANTISLEPRKRSAISAISLALADVKNYVQALDVANTISLEPDRVEIQGNRIHYTSDPCHRRRDTLLYIALKLVEERQFGSALRAVFSNACSSTSLNDEVLVAITNKLQEDKNFDGAATAASFISEWKKSYSLQSLAFAIAKSGDLVKAIQVANTISNDSIREDVLHRIFANTSG